MGRGNFGESGRPIGTLYRELCKNGLTTEMPFRMLNQVDPRNHVLDGVQILQLQEARLAECMAHCKT